MEKWLHARLNFVVFGVLAAGFFARLYAAGSTYLNPDEAFHYIILNQDSALFAYKVSLTNAHPPLIYLLVYYWSFLGRSELMLRLPSVLAGTIFCWAAYKWIGMLFGKAAGILGLILVSFSPVMIALSAQVRSYALVLCCETVALYLVEDALEQKSIRKMAYFALFLYLAILSHYSAVFFVLGVGIYASARLVEARSPRGVVATWIAGQVGALGIYWFLYVTHLSRLKSYIQSWQVSFDQNYSHTSHEHFLTYTWDRTIDIFLFLFDNPFLAHGLLLIWMASVIFLLLREWAFHPTNLRTRFSGVLLVVPIIGVFVAGTFGYYPYIGSRHTVFLAPFLIAALSFLIATISGRRLSAGVAIVALLACAMHTGGKLSEPYLTRENQRLGLMKDAIKYIRQTIPPDERIVTDYQSAIMLVYNFCGPIRILPLGAFSLPVSRFHCDGYTIASFQTWGMQAPYFLANFSKIARAQNLTPGDKIWVVQSGWGVTLAHELISTDTQFRCLNPKNFGDNISIFQLAVGPDFSPVAVSPNCSTAAASSQKL
jgi:Dolichyl-phosphate-mannose-protein mannosyltransferase